MINFILGIIIGMVLFPLLTYVIGEMSEKGITKDLEEDIVYVSMTKLEMEEYEKYKKGEYIMTQEEKQFLFNYIMGMNIKLNQIFRLIIHIVKKPGVNYDDVLKQFDDLTKIEKEDAKPKTIER